MLDAIAHDSDLPRDGITRPGQPPHPREAVALPGLARAMDDIPDTGDMDATLRGMDLVDGGPQPAVYVGNEISNRRVP